MTYTMDSPTQKFGYLDVKQSAKVKGRKLKTWKRRWVVLTKMTDMSSDQIVARIDLYDNEATWQSGSSQKTTFVFDHVTNIGKASSRTHPFAFEVCQNIPELVFSGESELDSFSWILVLQQIFTPHLVEGRKDSFVVSVQQNADASRWNLRGDYCLAISTDCLSLSDLDSGNCYISWGLSTLMRFMIDKNASSGSSEVLVIYCGRNGPTGESTFRFISPEASNIMNAIRLSICQALSQKQTDRGISVKPRDRSISESNSEKHFKSILDNSPFRSDSPGRERAGSGSSCGTLTPTSPLASNGIDNPLSNLSNNEVIPKAMTSRRSNVELASLDESDEQEESGEQIVEGSNPSDHRLSEKQQDIFHHHRQSSLPDQKVTKADDPGYAVINDVAGKDTRSRRNTISTDDSETTSGYNPNANEAVLPPPRKKRTNTVSNSKRSVSFEKEGEEELGVVPVVSSRTRSSSIENREPKGDHSKLEEVDRLVEDSNDSCWESGPSFGQLSRRRSSSTPNLHAFLMPHSSMENVYEELDAIRSMKPHSKPSQASPNEVPPALPARPFNLLLPSSRNDDTQTVNRLKKSFFFPRPKLHRGKSIHSAENPRPCACNYPYISNRGFLLSKDNNVMCGQCGGSMTDKKDEPDHQPTMIKDTSSSNTSINNPYSSILDINKIVSKRRRSFDITHSSTQDWTPKGHSELANPYKSSSLPRNISKQTKDTTSDGSLDEITNCRSANRPKDTNRLSYSKRTDPLISFFIDDDTFQSNPMVTGELATGSQHSSTDLLISLDSPKQMSNNDNFFSDGVIFNTQPTLSEQSLAVALGIPQTEISSISEPFCVNPFTSSPDIPCNSITDTSLLSTAHVTHDPISPWIISNNNNNNHHNHNNKCVEPLIPLNTELTPNYTTALPPVPMLSPAITQCISSATGSNEVTTFADSSTYFSMQTVSKDNSVLDPILMPTSPGNARNSVHSTSIDIANIHSLSKKSGVSLINPDVTFSTQISEENTYIDPMSLQQPKQQFMGF